MESITLAHQIKRERELEVSQPKWERITLLSILGYEAAGALVGGSFLIAKPDGRLMDMPVDIMHGVFSNFLIPGIILLGLGILNAFAFVSVLRRSRNDWVMAGLALGGLAIWFWAEIAILRELHWLHLMWGFPVFVGILAAIPTYVSRDVTRKALLFCGILSSLWYLVVNIYVPMKDEGYSVITQTVSELSAIGAPTRILWFLLCVLYPLLYVAFGWGILKSAAGNRPLRVVGILIIVYSVITFYWPPMHLRGNEMTLTDILHITWGMITILFMMFTMGFGAAALGKGFRIFSIISIALYVVFGVLIGIEAPNIATNGPTPMIGVWERINIGVYMLWIAVLAAVVLQKEKIAGVSKTNNV